MHPNVYKKQHKTPQSILHLCLCIMILSQSVSSQSCNVAVKMIKIYSPYTYGNLRIEGNKVVASRCETHCATENLYQITIDKYMLLYDIRSGKFICWNKAYTKLVARRNPTNLTYCKFEDKVSMNYPTQYTRYTTTHQGHESEIRFNSKGVFALRPIKMCFRQLKLPIGILTMSPSSISKRDYRKMSKCVSPDFLPDTRQCVSRLAEFCAEMKSRKDDGHNITSELKHLCKREWRRNY